PSREIPTTNRLYKNKQENYRRESTYTTGDDDEHGRSSRKFINKNRNEDERYKMEQEQKEREDDAHHYRKNGGPRWKVEAADDDL
ncbi:hypothetical protein R0J87_22245, partial [Halomonas sp. SIMBA_159]